MAEVRRSQGKRLTDKQLLSAKYRLLKATGGAGAVWKDVALLLGHIVVTDVRPRHAIKDGEGANDEGGR